MNKLSYFIGIFACVTLFTSCLQSDFSGRAQSPTLDQAVLSGNGEDILLTSDFSENGRIYIGGSFEQNLALGGINLTASAASDGVVAKYETDFTPLWSIQYSGASLQKVTRLKSTPDGGLIIAGIYNNELIINGTTFDSGITSQQIFIHKVNGAGQTLWTKRFIGTDSAAVLGIGQNSSGETIMVGSFRGSLTLDKTITSSKSNIFVAKLDSKGNPIWSNAIIASSSSTPHGFLLEGTGSSLIAASFAGTITIDGTQYSGQGGTEEGLIFRVSENGLVQLRKFLTTSDSTVVPTSITKSDDSTLVITGVFTDRFSNGVNTISAVGSGQDIFISKITPAGQFLWTKTFGGNASDQALSAVITDNGNIGIVGNFESTDLVFEGSSLSNIGGKDLFLAYLTSEGNPLVAQSFGGDSDDIIYSILTYNNELYLTGSFNGTGTIGTLNFTTNEEDMFLFRYDR